MPISHPPSTRPASAPGTTRLWDSSLFRPFLTVVTCIRRRFRDSLLAPRSAPSRSFRWHRIIVWCLYCGPARGEQLGMVRDCLLSSNGRRTRISGWSSWRWYLDILPRRTECSLESSAFLDKISIAIPNMYPGTAKRRDEEDSWGRTHTLQFCFAEYVERVFASAAGPGLQSLVSLGRREHPEIR